MLGRSHLVVAGQPELGREGLQRGEVCLQLLGQFTQVLLLELAHAAFLLFQPKLRLGELRPQERGRAGGLLLAGPGILLGVELGQGVRHDGHGPRVAPRVAERKGDGTRLPAGRWAARGLDLESDVAAQPLHEGLGGHVRAEVGIQVEAGHQLLEPGAAQDLLADRLQACLELAGHGGPHERLGDLLTLHEHGRGGSVQLGHREDDSGANGER